MTTAPIPFPITCEDEAVERILRATSPRTRLALLDHVTSPTGLVLPLERILPALRDRGVEVLVDGAHAPGMLDLNLSRLRELGATYYTGNCHKWVSAPKGAAFLFVPEPHQPRVRPVVISHGASVAGGPRSRFHREFDWPGTVDPTAWLSVPAALDTVATLHPDGWPGLRAANRALALEARRILCAALGIDPPAPESLIGALAAVPLPPGDAAALQDRLLLDHRIEVPVIPWPAPGARILRISAQRYNHRGQYERLAKLLVRLL